MPFFVLRLIVGLGSIAGLFFGAKAISERAEKKQFNKGVCAKCGGHFKFIEGTIGSPAKGYKCDVCDNCVWVTEGADIGYEYTQSFTGNKFEKKRNNSDKTKPYNKTKASNRS